jgi:iron complex outermembrane receptor protein
LGDLRIEEETSHKLGLVYKGSKGKFSWDLSTYLSKINQFIVPVPTAVELTIRGIFPVWEYRQTDALIWGLDGQLSAKWHQHWETYHTMRYIHGQDVRNDQPLIHIPAPQINNSLIFNKASWKSLSMEIESIFTLRQGRYPDYNFMVFIPETHSYEELDISTPPDGYFLLNVRAQSVLVSSEKFNVRLGLGLNNLLNVNYRDYLNRLRFYADEPGRSLELTLKLEY